MSMENPQVLYISPNGYIGGAERFVLDICNAHKKNGEFLPSIFFYGQGEALREAKEHGINIHILKNSFRLSNPITFVRAMLEIRKLIKKIKPDIVHLTMPYSHISTFLPLLLTGSKSVWFQHGPVGGTLDKVAAVIPCDMVMFNSTYLQEEHNRVFSINSVSSQRKIPALISSDPADSKSIENFKNRYSISSENLNLGFSGRICHWKGIHTVLNAIKAMRNSLTAEEFTKIKYYIAGSPKNIKDKEYYFELENLIDDESLGSQVIFLGHLSQEEIRSFYASLDLLIHSPIIPEPFGMAPAEAMLQGKLVLGGDEGGVTEFLKNQITGLTFSSTKDEASIELKEILLSIFKDWKNNSFIEKYSSIRAAAHKKILEEHNPDTVCRIIENHYKDLIES